MDHWSCYSDLRVPHGVYILKEDTVKFSDNNPCNMVCGEAYLFAIKKEWENIYA